MYAALYCRLPDEDYQSAIKTLQISNYFLSFIVIYPSSINSQLRAHSIKNNASSNKPVILAVYNGDNNFNLKFHCIFFPQISIANVH